jgi:hypothetical protein
MPMAVSKLNAEDAQEWLESLQQVGEGWWRQVGLAVRANAHKSLGMDRREFVATIGQKLVDPREAIIELYEEKYTIEAIADILGVSRERTVERVLAEAGLIEWKPYIARLALESGYDVPADVIDEEDPTDETLIGEEDRLRTQIEALEVKLRGEQTKRKREVQDVKDRLAELRKAVTEEKRRARKEAESKLTEAERERARKEAEAWAEEQGQKILAGFSALTVEHIVGALQEATDDIRLLIKEGGVNDKALRKIETAHAGFQEELNVARMAVSVG